MKKPVSIHISLPNPCQQDWANMQRAGKGLHCTDCKKTVVDFTKMSDAAIIAFLQRETLSCGLFRVDQLNREIALPVVRKAPFGAKWLAAVLLFFGWMKESNAQHKAAAKPGTHHAPASKQKKLPAHNSNHVKKQDSLKIKSLDEQVVHVNNYRTVLGGVPPEDYHAQLSIGSGRGTGTKYIIDGVALNPGPANSVNSQKRSFRSRLLFWKRHHK